MYSCVLHATSAEWEINKWRKRNWLLTPFALSIRLQLFSEFNASYLNSMQKHRETKRLKQFKTQSLMFLISSKSSQMPENILAMQ